MPLYFSYYVKQDDEFYNEMRYNLSTFTYNGRTPFFYSQLGIYITYLQVFIRDIMSVFLEGMTSCLALYHLRKFNKNHIQLIQNNPNQQEMLRKKISKEHS